ncbi:MAG TPA: hypothetical protein VEB22_03360, partial [Phycisphaerales bacterium]|nr:hypothetical protein [Phycisphaerales bacterium]
HAGRLLVAGLVEPGFVTAVAEEGLRVQRQGDERSRRSSCSRCGRVNEEMTPGKQWFKKSDVGERRLFVGVSGTGLILTERVVADLPRTLRGELKLNPLEVRDA